MKTIEELENEIKNLSEELEKLKQEKENKRWRGSLNQKYYYISSDTNCCFTRDYHYPVDNIRYSIGNYFQTEKQAQETVEKIKVYTQLKDLALRLNKGEKIDWTNVNQYKYLISYDYDLKKLDLKIDIIEPSLGQIYCSDKNFLDMAKQEIGEENLLKLFEED